MKLQVIGYMYIYVYINAQKTECTFPRKSAKFEKKTEKIIEISRIP